MALSEFGKLQIVPRKQPFDRRRRRFVEDAAQDELASLREPLFRELEKLHARPEYRKLQEGHKCCTREFNQMRISPLEANAIRDAFRRDPELKRRLPEVLARLEAQLETLEDNEERQAFDCPLLDGKLCMVHNVAKPIGCLAWHPPKPDAEPSDYTFTRRGWDAFASRDALNDRYVGSKWKLKVIPLWLKRVFSQQLERRRKREDQEPRREAPPQSASTEQREQARTTRDLRRQQPKRQKGRRRPK